MSPNQSANAAQLVEVWRGPIIESRHLGHLIAVDATGIYWSNNSAGMIMRLPSGAPSASG